MAHGNRRRTSNANGLRDEKQPMRYLGVGTLVLILGDSFTFGFEVTVENIIKLLVLDAIKHQKVGK